MKVQVQKQIVTTEPAEIEIVEVDLLDSTEYKRHMYSIPMIDADWFLQPDDDLDWGYYVNSEGSMVFDCIRGSIRMVRPVLRMYSDLQRKDKFNLAGYSWTVLSRNLALCDEAVMSGDMREILPEYNVGLEDEAIVDSVLRDWARMKGLISE